MSVSPITSHVLDTALGRPALGVPITLERKNDEGKWEQLGAGATDDDGRLKTLLPAGAPAAKGVYRVTFDTGAYFEATQQRVFYPECTVVFVLDAPDQHYHIPLLLSPFGYSTYRGS